MEATQKPFTRKKPDQLVYLELGSGNGGMLLSISEDGFRFRAVSPLRPDGLMPFAFSFDGSQRLQGIGEVEWLEDDGKSGGMRFVEVSPDFRSALEQWLALDSPRGKSGREATPATATPLDSMEKIREELRRGYPQPVAKPSAHKESQQAPPSISPPKHELPTKKSPVESRAQQTKAVRQTAEHPERHGAASRSAEYGPEQTGKKTERTDLRDASSAPTSEREQRSQPPRHSDWPGGDRSHPFEQRSQPFYPPPFTHPAESESSAAAEKASSAFLKKSAPSSAPAPAPADNAVRSGFSTSQQAAPVTSESSRSREEAHASAETLRRPFRPEARSTPSERPYIPPPVDESFEAAWERAKLTPPPESPHLSRAAAGSIIGVALAVILGALAFNFRQDIGEVVIDLGQKISGGNHAAPAPSVPASENKPESQTAANPSGPASAAASDRSDTPASQTAPAQNTGSSNSPSETRTVGSTTQHDASSGAARDANPVAPRHTASTGTAPNPVPNGTVNASGGATTGGGAFSVPAGSIATTIGTEPGSGQDEFNAAREMLKGDHRHRDLSKAVDLLWAGVRKGYVPAEVTLADLYRRGDGVEKNCDQAQVLLVVASKKGSPEARQMLELMAEQGCSD